MRLLWLAIRLYPESAAARRFVIVSLLGLVFAAAGFAALAAFLYRSSPLPQVVVPLLDQVVSMERPGTLLTIVGVTLFLAGAAIVWLTLASFREEFLPDTDEAYRLLLLQLMAFQKERDRSSVVLIGNGPAHRAVAVALARTNLDVRVLRLPGGEPERAYLLALARNAAVLAPVLERMSPVSPAAVPAAAALDELYPLRTRLVDYRPETVDGEVLRRLLGAPGLIAAVVEDAARADEYGQVLASGGLRDYLAASAVPKLIVLPTVAADDAATLLGRADPDRLFDTVVVNAARSAAGRPAPTRPFLAYDRTALARLGYAVHDVPLVDWENPDRWNPEDVATVLFAELARRLLRRMPTPKR